ncbi:cell wall metabolism sensor histidine kinase WalK [Leifsonia sp. TF02-11]|uniref:sensor histidine kinase n=1 Tax=Leifsonia sp. TF02-11 TaxID=2815212 RepID=UPI001AA1586D|nr:HAMP domain-containing sensor histidine kinase [Leifsonia sp. TF02-11]MBN9630852.1 HAMP domain-containing histidine kinase [Actinomycetota bacterium]MBO1737583.1 HAMP domain-containing histidine kinase [Leifsonia sp. TF02-11]
MTWLRRLSITARITIGSLVVATLFGLVAVVVIRVGVASILHNATNTLLTNDVTAPAASVEANPAGPFDLPGGGQELAVVDANGDILASTLPESLEDRIPRLLALGSSPSTFSVNGNTYDVLVRTVATTAGDVHVIAARNDETTSLILDRLTLALLVGALVLILGFGAASWLLARTALRPVSRMREQADRIAGGESTGSGDDPEGLLTVGPAQDELSELATTLNDLIRRLRASADRERQMVSDASHELRTPLAVLRGQLELAELDAGDADALLDDIRSSHSTALRLGQLANNLLELSRIEAGPSSGRIDWRTLVDELTDAIDRARLLVSSDEDARPISVDFDYDPKRRPDPASRVALSPTDFGRILDNLLGNAITAIRTKKAGAGPEDVVSATLNVETRSVVLTVHDSGPGMPEDFIPVALDRFTRADGARTSTSGGGGGLGLAIVAALAGAAGGSVQLANAPSGGLVVTVRLPLVRV